jgi:hypothetical protein
MNRNGSRPGVRALALLSTALLLAGATVAVARAEADATGFLLPERAQPFDVGGRMVIQGVPTDVAGFVSPQPPAVVAAWVKARWPGLHADDRAGHRRVLGRLAGDRYLTLQIEPAPGGGTRGLWASVPVREALRVQASGGDRRTPSHPLPIGSQPVAALEAVDAGARVRTHVVRNRLDVATNADHLSQRLAADGLVLEHRTVLADASRQAQGEWMQFAGQGRQASALIHRERSGETTVSLVRRDPAREGLR